MSVVVVVGTRPEAIKLKPVIEELQVRGIETCAVSSGQHDLSDCGIRFDVVMEQEPPDHLSERTGRMVERVSKILGSMAVDSVIIQGDTATVLAAGIAAYLRDIPVVHVEAGLRTDDLRCPFPEEGIRQMISRIATLNCAATPRAFEALKAEGVSGMVVQTGNTIVDAVYANLGDDVAWPDGWKDVEPRIIVTCHRRENWGHRAEMLAEALEHLPACHIVLHSHPMAREPFERLSDSRHHLQESISHQKMLAAISMADLVISDSGGMAEEAAVLGTRTIIYRDRTERMESVEAGVAELVPDARNIPSIAIGMLQEGNMKGTDAFGDGHAAIKIVTAMMEMKLI